MKISTIQTGPLSVNTYLVEDENTKKAFIVDPGGYSSQLTEYVKNNHLDIEYIILTHGHGDHIGGVSGHLEDFAQAKVVACQYEKEMLEDPDMNSSIGIFGMPVTVNADIFVKDGDTLQVGDMSLRFIHTPGHSPGGMCIYVENVLFSGDTLFCQSVGRTDFQGGSFETLKQSVHEKLFVLPEDTSVFPGHMGNTSIGFEKENNPFV